MKKALLIFLILFFIAGVAGLWGYNQVFSNNTAKEYALFIPKGSSFQQVLKTLEKNKVLDNPSSFERVAGWMNYDKSIVPSGKYSIDSSWSNKALVSKLRSGDQDPVRLTINNVRKIENLAAKFASNLELDSVTLINEILDEATLKKLNKSKETVLSTFIPNTYEIWWDVSATELVDKMKSENDKFWSQNNRAEKASKQGLSKEEVYTLASIVEKETQHNPEKPLIAGVYLNRLNKGMMLQADPTVVFANEKFDLKRVLNKHLEIDSPYNTYKNNGLPPGPIYMPGIKSIDAVLNPKKHNYLYFCAEPGLTGKHAFATNLIQHNKNANRYWNWLKKKKIK